MKFTTPIYALIAASAVLAYPQAGQNSVEGIPKDCDANFYKEINDCVPDNDKDSIRARPYYGAFEIQIFKSSEEYCSLYNSEKCKNFYTNFMTNASKCGILDKENTENFEIGLKILEYLCVPDENNKICPAFTKDGQYNVTETINYTCKSNICTDSYLKVYELVNGPENISASKGQVFNKDYVYDDSDRKGKKILAFLLSDYFTGQQNAQSSGATTMKYSVFGTLLAMAYALL
ncbi:hypothetical protein PIROE2DRAFT_2211 [Piromyces sp. E2]|nr:hypothetical protein PIROE2DRAFT_2211 [Piromyces sp. E2]|eukprot:OUM69788.1 hypothetical protein PIROE2DRAFT_2211 [Piromyces sp. E2]